jgi:predicted nucleotidyltransferase
MTLYEFIKNEPSAKIIFGKGEIEIIKKQLLGQKLKQYEKNILSRSIRKKFNFIKKCSVFKEEFDVKKGGEVYKQLEILRDWMLLDQIGKNIKKIYIFGSFVENKMSSNSDVDIAIEFNEIDKKEISKFKKRILEQKKDLFDISIFNNLPINIQSEVKKNGKVFFENK